MLGNFTYCNPTKLHFGPNAMDALAGELTHYGPKVQLIYGGGSIKKNGIYDQVVAILKAAGKEVFEDPGVMPNPTVEKLYEGCKIARENDVDLLAVCGRRLLLATMPRRSPSPPGAMRTPGKSTTCGWRTRTTSSSPWGACSPWWARARR